MIPIRGSVRGVRLPYATVALITVNVAVFFYQLSLPPAALDRFVFDWGVVPAREVWALNHAPLALHLWLLPIFSSMFVHGGWLHIAGNMLFLWVFGEGVEARLGGPRFLVLFFAAGIAASQAQVLFAADPRMPMIGASGAIAGVLGGYLLLFPLATVTILVPILIVPLFFEVPALFFLIFWFLEQLFLGSMATLSPVAGQAAGIAWLAHIGGFASGALLVHLLKPGRPRLSGRSRPTRTMPASLWDGL